MPHASFPLRCRERRSFDLKNVHVSIKSSRTVEIWLKVYNVQDLAPLPLDQLLQSLDNFWIVYVTKNG